MKASCSWETSDLDESTFIILHHGNPFGPLQFGRQILTKHMERKKSKETTKSARPSGCLRSCLPSRTAWCQRECELVNSASVQPGAPVFHGENMEKFASHHRLPLSAFKCLRCFKPSNTCKRPQMSSSKTLQRQCLTTPYLLSKYPSHLFTKAQTARTTTQQKEVISTGPTTFWRTQHPCLTRPKLQPPLVVLIRS